MPAVHLTATITCPACGAQTEADMPTESCQFFWECPSCHRVLRPEPGDCCVFCSYANTPCPPVQQADAPRDPGDNAPAYCS